LDSLLESFFRNGESGVESLPALDLSETNEAIEVRMNVPGVKPENIDVQVNGSLLTITGKSEEEKEEKGKTYHRIERRQGQFSRSVTLPCSINEEKVIANCKEGVLSIHLPKTAEAKNRRIKVSG
jgi:HSP20 family protein